MKIRTTIEEDVLIENYIKSKNNLKLYFSVKYFYDYFVSILDTLEFSDGCNYECEYSDLPNPYGTIIIYTPNYHFKIIIDSCFYEDFGCYILCVKNLKIDKNYNFSNKDKIYLNDPMSIKRNFNLFLNTLEDGVIYNGNFIKRK